MEEKLYKVLAYIGRIVLPALSVALISLGEVWTISHYKEIANTIMIVDTLLNTLLQIDSNKYFKDVENQ